MKRQVLHMLVGFTALSTLYVLVHYTRPSGNQGLSSSYMEDIDRSGVAVSWATNFEDNRLFVGFYQNAFAAKVIAEIGRVANNAELGFSNIQYDAEVIYNIKGEARGRIVVDLDATKGTTLVPGYTYVLGAIHQRGSGRYYVGFHPAMSTVVTQDASLGHDQLRKLVLKHPRTYELLNAYPNEILHEAHIEHGNIDNAFIALTEEEKQTILAKFDELIPSRPLPEILPPIPTADTSWQTLERGTRCFDGVDNDGNGLIDRAEAECSGYYREDLPSPCKDEQDNDLDGLKDAQDPDCAQFYPPPPAPLPLPPPPPPTVPTSTSPAPAPSSTPQ